MPRKSPGALPAAPAYLSIWLALALAVLSATTHARTLAEIKARGVIALCANPDSLPHSSQNGTQPGFQIEIARALAQGLGVTLELSWIFPTMRANLVNCDILMDAFNDPEVHEGRLKLSIPYQRSGVALGLQPGTTGVRTFSDIKPGQKVGVMTGSLAQTMLGKMGLTTSPYAWEREMVEDVAKGDLFACASSPATISWYNHIQPARPLVLAYAYDDTPELSWTVTVGMRKADDALVKSVNEVLTKMMDDGTIAAIYAKYGVEWRRP